METIQTTAPAEAGRDARRRRRNRERDWKVLLATLAIVIAILLVLLFSRGYSTLFSMIAERGRTTGHIVAVPRKAPDGESVSLWLKSGADLSEVLSRHGLPTAGAIMMGDGTYVVRVPGGKDPQALVRELKQDGELVDAGHVYLQDQPAQP